MPVFAENAHRLRAAGLPIIPLIPNEKRPAVLSWQKFSNELPSQDEIDSWARRYPTSNVGLVMGKAGNLCAIDIDTLDNEIVKIILGVIPASPWQRVGAKGAVYLYRFSNLKTFRILMEDSKTPCVEMLSTGAQIAIPPSIHPVTKREYTANAEITEILDQLCALPSDIEQRLRTALINAGYKLSHRGWTKISEVISVGNRDNAMVCHAGLLARAVLRRERTLLEAVQEIGHWVENFTQRVEGDQLSPAKAQKKLIEMLARDVVDKRVSKLPVGWDTGITDELAANLGLSVFDDDAKEWSFDKFQEEIKRFASYTDYMDKLGLLSRIMEQLSKATTLTDLHVSSILNLIHAHDKTFKITDLRRQIKTISTNSGLRGENHTEIARAAIEFMGESGEIRNNATKFWQYNGSYWEPRSTDRMVCNIADKYGHLPAARRNSDLKGILAIMQSISAEALIRRGMGGVNFANGFLDQDGVLHEHHPDFGCTYMLPYPYKPELAGKCEQFNAFLYHSWGRDDDYAEKVQCLREMMAATLFGAATEFARAILLYGVAKSGKSVLLSIMKGLLPPESWTAVSPHDFRDKFIPSGLFGKLLNVCGELSETKALESTSFKSIISGDEITAQEKNKDPFVFRPRCAHWFAANHLPRCNDTSAGFSRRWGILEFSRPIAPQDQVLDLANQILAEEAQGISAWVVEAFKGMRNATDYNLPQSHHRLMNDLANLNNSVRWFLTTRSQPGGSTSMDNLMKKYVSFCFENSVRPVPPTAVSLIVRQLGLELGFQSTVNADSCVVELIGITV